MKNKLMKPTAFILGVVMLSLLSVSLASAQSESVKYLPIVEKIAQKFNLSKDEVQAVFDEERDSHHAELQARFSGRLDDLVSAGKISEEEKNAILKKHEEMHNRMLELKDMEPEERREKMKNMHEDFKTWAEEQDIELPMLGKMRFLHKRGVHGVGEEFKEKFEVRLED